MWKALMLDDEAGIDKCLKKKLEDIGFDIQVMGDPLDLEEARRLVSRLRPDIILVDINTHHADRLDFVQWTGLELPQALVVIMSRLHNFEYAQRAIHLRVFDYILKPTVGQRLYDTFRRAARELEQSERQRDFLHFSSQQISNNLSLLREKLLCDYLQGAVPVSELHRHMGFLGADMRLYKGLLVIASTERLTTPVNSDNNIGGFFEYGSELMRTQPKSSAGTCAPDAIFFQYKKNCFAIFRATIEELEDVARQVFESVDEKIRRNAVIKTAYVEDMARDMRTVCRAIAEEISCADRLSPITLAVKNYIECNYQKENVRVHDITSVYNVSVSYVGKLLRQELESSFVEYLTKTRMMKAIHLLRDPLIKINSISRLVGYSDQHYFSSIFKKYTGLSPGEYRKTKLWTSGDKSPVVSWKIVI